LSQIQVLAGIITGGAGTNLAGAYGGMRRSVRGIKAGSEATGRGISNSARGIMRGANRFDKAAVGALDRRDAQKQAMQREVTKNSQV
jgi:hypothetical protein